MLNNEITQVFQALADPTRQAIVHRLSRGDATVGQLAQPFDISAPAISRHLKVLENAQLIVRTKEAQHRRLRLNTRRLKLAEDWIADQRQFWDESLDRLEELVSKK